MKQSFSPNSQNSKDEIYNQIESLIQQQYQIFVPALVLEYSNEMKDNFEWEYDDLHQVCSYFGEIDTLEINGKNAFVLFKNFFDAYSCKEYLLNTNNFKVIDNNNNIKIKWYTSEDENKINSNIQDKIKKINHTNYPNNFPNNNNYNYSNKENHCYNMNTPYAYNSGYNPNPNNRQEFNYIPSPQNMYDNNMNMMNQYNYNMMGMYNYNQNSSEFYNKNNYPQQKSYNYNTNNNINNSYKDIYNDNDFDDKRSQDKNFSGKHTCRFEIQIENDKDFQVARRLIGAKGCNMKRIIEKCNSSGRKNEESVKLRLRGRGSGFKEGQNKQESDEPLHLCISSKYYEKYETACILVQELIMNIYEEYKRFCERAHKTPISNLSLKKYEGIFSSKETSKNFGEIGKKCDDYN